MKYRFTIEIKPCVNFDTHSAEVYVIDDGYDGCGRYHQVRYVVRQKQAAEAAAEAYCSALAEELKDVVRQKLASLSNAKP